MVEIGIYMYVHVDFCRDKIEGHDKTNDTHFFCYDDPALADLDPSVRGEEEEEIREGREARAFRAVYEEDVCTTEEVFAILKMQHLEVR